MGRHERAMSGQHLHSRPRAITKMGDVLCPESLPHRESGDILDVDRNVAYAFEVSHSGLRLRPEPRLGSGVVPRDPHDISAYS
jgi:hypothetical protein